MLSRNSKQLAIVAIVAMTLYGCTAITTSIDKSELSVETKMSETIFLEPTSPSNKIVYVSIRNTTDKKMALKQRIISVLQNSGFTVTKDPDSAKFMLQANVLKLDKSDAQTAGRYLASGYGASIVAGAAIGGVAGGGGGFYRGAAAGGVLGGIGEWVGNRIVKDTFFVMVTDLQVRERPLKGERVIQGQETRVKQGSSTGLAQSSRVDNVQWKIYRTRIVSTANQSNLKFEGARPELEKGLILSISGLFREE